MRTTSEQRQLMRARFLKNAHITKSIDNIITKLLDDIDSVLSHAKQAEAERDALAELLSTEKGCIHNNGCKYRGDDSWMCPDCYREYATREAELDAVRADK